MFKEAVFISIVTVCLSAFGAVQFDIRGNRLFTQQEPGTGALNQRSVDMKSYFHAERELYPGLFLYMTHSLDGTPHADALPENKIPFDNHTVFGFKYLKKHMFFVEIQNDIFAHADRLSLNFYPTDSSINQKVLSSVNEYFQANGKKVRFTAGVNYFRLNYDLQYGEHGITKAVDDDMWSEIDFRISPNDNIAMAIGTTLKNDFNSYGGYDYGDHYISLGGDHTIRMKARRLYFAWLISEHWRVSEIMYLREDAEGPATVLHMRPVLKLRNRIFIKGTATLDLSKRMQKQRYEMSLRKSWRNRSSIGIGYWTTPGSVFPRKGSGIRSVFYIGKASKVGFSPNAQFFWRLDPDNNSYRYYRATTSFEMILNIFKRAEVIGGYKYTRFIDLAPFTNRGVVSIGLRKW